MSDGRWTVPGPAGQVGNYYRRGLGLASCPVRARHYQPPDLTTMPPSLLGFSKYDGAPALL
jgi:hypothetical protein